ncbi:hypothetical protein ARMGADRAFT_622487 [Armillaria gallica]|uniref:Cyclic nucleotide-binding domain-containing protein n=1 Tax=Armillaria gallica TaxID=47427 RepID=A0A2H3D6H5_ARMGA|nr:hypothetical protein ARMGADRAFT_622487 [Armillaria gallica]
MSGRDHGRLTPPLVYHLLSTCPQREPLPTLSRALSSYTSLDLSLLPTYLSRVCYLAGHVLWQQNDPLDGLYVVEKGILQVSNKTYIHPPHIEESMVSGTVAGKFLALSNMQRNVTVVVERDVVLWKLSQEANAGREAHLCEAAR